MNYVKPIRGCILYDLDGVLVNACDWHYEALNRALEMTSGIKISRDEHETEFNGLPTKTKLDLLVKQERIDPQHIETIWSLKQELTVETIQDLAKVDEEKIELHERMFDTLAWPIACVTNSISKTAKLMLSLTGQLDYMSFLVTNEDVRFPKPSPEGYINAMVRMNVVPKYTLIVEDSNKGLTAARATCANILHVKDATETTHENVLRASRYIIRGER